MYILEIKDEVIKGKDYAELSRNYLKQVMKHRWTNSILGEFLFVRDENNKVVNTISFNGRIWPASPKGDHTDCLYSPPDGEGLHVSRVQNGTIRS